MANANKNLAKGEGTRALGDKQAFPTDQIYTIVNAVTEQSMGGSPITAIDTASLVALGNAILSSLFYFL